MTSSSKRKIDSSSRQRVAHAAQTLQDELVNESRIQSPTEDKVAQISWSDIKEQNVVGIGGFSRVTQVKIDSISESKQQSFALKSLKKNVMEHETFFLEAAKDLSAEAVILSKVQHKNIVKLHAITQDGPFKSYTETDRGYFLVLDLLDDTLENKLEKERKELFGNRGIKGNHRRTRMPSSGNGNNPLGSLFSSGNHKRCAEHASEVYDRMQNVAMGIGKGLAHLHKNNVVLRDLKPDNIGFDSEGEVKIFDLGFARELHTIDDAEVCGTLRYMAPEIMRGEKYTTAADVYSYGVVLWELATLQRPFDKFKTAKTFIEQVAHYDLRPNLSAIQSVPLRRIIEQCWNPDPTKRPSMARVTKSLSLQLGRYAGIISPVERQFSRRMITISQSFSGAIDTLQQGPSEVSSMTTKPSSGRAKLATIPSKVALAFSNLTKIHQHAGPFLTINKNRKQRKFAACQA